MRKVRQSHFAKVKRPTYLLNPTLPNSLLMSMQGMDTTLLQGAFKTTFLLLIGPLVKWNVKKLPRDTKAKVSQSNNFFPDCKEELPLALANVNTQKKIVEAIKKSRPSLKTVLLRCAFPYTNGGCWLQVALIKREGGEGKLGRCQH